MIPRRSLRLRLTLLTAGVLAVALAVGAVALTAVVGQSRTAALDDVVRERAVLVADLARGDRVPGMLPVAEPGEIVQLLDAEGRVIATSPSGSRTLPVLPADVVASLRGDALGTDPDRPVVVRTTDASPYDGTARAAVAPARHGDHDVTAVATMPLGEIRALTGALRVALLGVVPVLTALMGAVVWTVLGRALRPVEEMRVAAERVAATGGHGGMPPRAADDELGALSRTLDDMLARLGDALDRQRAATDRQRRFVADAAHELRSPLAALRATIEVAQTHPGTYPGEELAQDLAPEVLRMQRLVDDLLLLARVGGAERPQVPVDLRVAADDAVVASGAAAAPGAPEVAVAGAGGAVGDPAALTRVVRNLVDNAVRHAAGRVVVTVAHGRVTVDDDGPGVPPQDRERVFERFVRLDEAREREVGGSGLGLAIAREIARDHGGDVLLADRPDGPGLRAVLDLEPRA